MHESRPIFRKGCSAARVAGAAGPRDRARAGGRSTVRRDGRSPVPNGSRVAGPATTRGRPANCPPSSTAPPSACRRRQPLFTADTNAVTVDVAVLDNKGQFIANIPPGNFQILEDGVPQKIVSVGADAGPGKRSRC